MIDHNILEKLNAPTAQERIQNLIKVLKETRFVPIDKRYINNHIHTTYSFSPYSPTAAVFAARYEGLCTAGIVDHDSIGGAHEFLAAAELIGIPATIGLECRVSFAGTTLANKRTNNPDQIGVSYMTIQSVPHGQIDKVQSFFKPYRHYRNIRNEKMAANINEIFAPYEIVLDFEKDILPLSMYSDGGSVTERHLMFALAKALINHAGKGAKLADLLLKAGVNLSDNQQKMLNDTDYQFYDYDVLGILKGAFIQKVYVDPTDELVALKDIVRFSNQADAILCYAYLGDVSDNLTGDKIKQQFEDDYLEELFIVLRENGVSAVTYMPARNSKEQLIRVREMCNKYHMFQVSGEDINSPRQNFICHAMEDPMFDNLIQNTWELIRHEREK